MSGSVAAVVLVAWTLVFMRPLTAGLLPPALRTPLVLGLTSAALGFGVITLVPTWVMVAVPGGPAFPVAVGVSVVACAGGLVLFGWPVADGHSLPSGDLPPVVRLTCAWVIGLSAAAIVFDAVYWPFENGDALAVYALFSRHLYETSTLPAFDGIADAYPMLVPMGYALMHWANGGLNEYLARLVPAVMAVLAIGATGALGGAVGSSVTGWVAAAMVAATPVFGRWATSGYTDVPTAFFIALSVLFAVEWRRSPSPRTLVLAGVMAGLAAWTKNSALAALPGLAWVILAGPLNSGPQMGRRSIGTLLRRGVLVAGGLVLTSAPWYLRSELVFGHAIPPTALVDQAQHTWQSAAVMLRPGQFFSLSGVLFTAGFVLVLIAVMRGKDRDGQRALLLAFSVPVFAAWWWMASYEARFLMIIVPVMAAMAALTLEDLARAAVWNATPRARTAWSVALSLTAVIACGVALRKTVEHKDVLVRNPWPSDAERHRVRLRGLWDVIELANALPAGTRIGGVPPGARYHIRSSRLPLVGFGNFRDPLAAYAGRFDIVVYRDPAPSSVQEGRRPLLQTRDGFVAYAVNEPSSHASPAP